MDWIHRKDCIHDVKICIYLTFSDLFDLWCSFQLWPISLFNNDDYRLSGSKAWGWLVKFCIAKFAFDSGQDWIKYDILELVTNFGIEIIQQITLDSIFKLNMFAKYPNLLVNNCDCGIVFFTLCCRRIHTEPCSDSWLKTAIKCFV